MKNWVLEERVRAWTMCMDKDSLHPTARVHLHLLHLI